MVDSLFLAKRGRGVVFATSVFWAQRKTYDFPNSSFKGVSSPVTTLTAHHQPCRSSHIPHIMCASTYVEFVSCVLHRSGRSTIQARVCSAVLRSFTATHAAASDALLGLYIHKSHLLSPLSGNCCLTLEEFTLDLLASTRARPQVCYPWGHLLLRLHGPPI